MSYTISQVAQMMGVTPSTLRYYDKEACCPTLSASMASVFSKIPISPAAYSKLPKGYRNADSPDQKIR